MQNNSFIASIGDYGFKEDRIIISENSNLPSFNKQDSYFNENVINLDDLNLEELTMQLSGSLNKNQPIFLWSKEREVKKIELDIQRQRMLKSRIETLKEMGEELMHLRADAIVSEQMIILLSKMNKSKAKAELKRIVEKSKTELSYYKMKVQENFYAEEKLKQETEFKKKNSKAEIQIKNSKIKLFKLLKKKMNDNSISKIPVEILHEIFHFYLGNSQSDIESIAKYNKIMSDIGVNQADAFKIFADGKSKMSDSVGKDLDNELKSYNMKSNQKSNAS